MAVPTLKVPDTIPQDVKCDLIALAVLRRQFLEGGAGLYGPARRS